MLVLAGCGTSQALTARASSPQAEEQQLKSLSLAELGQVRITSTSKQPEEVWRTPAPVFVLTSEDIRRSGATNLPDLLRMVPGVQVSRSQSDEWAVGIRGFASNFSKGLLVMIDGRSVYTPLFEGVYWDVQDLVLADIDRIEVIRGPAGAVWGLNAVNGIINIVTKDAKDTQGTMASALGGGAVERFIGEAQQGWRLPRQYLTARIYAKGFNRGPEINPGGNPYDTWHQERGGFRADWTPNARDHVTAEADVYQGESGGQNTIGRFFPPRQQIVQGGQPVSGGDFIVRWDRTLSASRNFYLEAYFDRTNRKTLQFGETRDTFDVDFVDHVGDLPRQDLIFGGGLRESPSNLVQLYRSVNFSPNQLTDYIYSGFVQDRIAIVPERLDAVLGTKIEDNNYSGVGVEPSARLLWTATPHRTPPSSQPRSLGPSASVRWTARSRRLQAGAGGLVKRRLRRLRENMPRFHPIRALAPQQPPRLGVHQRVAAWLQQFGQFRRARSLMAPAAAVQLDQQPGPGPRQGPRRPAQHLQFHPFDVDLEELRLRQSQRVEQLVQALDARLPSRPA